MCKMSQEVHELLEENRERSITARSTRNRRGHTGKSGSVRLPSDNLTCKQLEAMNGKCVTYRLGAPMTWAEFKLMPNDLKIEYIKKLRQRYNVPDCYLAEAMGVPGSTFGKCIRDLKLGRGRAAGAESRAWYDTELCDRFVNFWCGFKETPTYGQVCIEGDATKTLLELAETLKGKNVKLTVNYTVMED